MPCWTCSLINSVHNLYRFYSQVRRSKNCCVAFGCSNSPTNHPELSYHTFPKNEVRKEKWISAVKRKGWTPSNSSVLCSAHFSRDSYCRPPGGKQRALLKGDAVPSIFSSYPTYLQSPPAKTRRILVRGDVAGPSSAGADVAEQISEIPETTNEVAPAEPVEKKPRGRPPIPVKKQLPKLRKSVHALRKQVLRLKRKAQIQKNVLALLQKDSKIQQAQLDVIDGCLGELVKNQAKNKIRKKRKEYSQKIKEFALTIYYYSPKAYAYLRTVLELPASRSIRRWLEVVDCQPGFLSDVLSLISEKQQDSPYSLVVDSMAIRKRLIVDRSTGNIQGHCTVGDTTKVAKEALVFLLVPLLGGVRYPVGYFLVDKIDSDVQSQLIRQCLEWTAESNIKIVNITCDGCQSNMTTLKKLGADIPHQNYFTHPSQQMHHKVFVTLDAVHMLKLARNALGSIRKFQSTDGLVEYRYLEDLIHLQENMGLRLANKLTKRHLKWTNMKMKVKLAAQMLSSSVADALEYLRKTDVKFKDAGPTIRFIREVRIFAMLLI